MEFLTQLSLLVPSFVIAISVHEWAHAATALWLGDRTAQRAGRVTLNPLSHIDPLGALMIVVAGIGWGRPVPVAPRNFSHPRAGMALTAFAGPLSNFLLAFVTLALLFATTPTHWWLLEFGKLLVWINIFLGTFNLLPLPPLDGGNILTNLLPRKLGDAVEDWISAQGQNLLIGFFALILIEQYTEIPLLITLVKKLSGMIFLVLQLAALQIIS